MEGFISSLIFPLHLLRQAYDERDFSNINSLITIVLLRFCIVTVIIVKQLQVTERFLQELQKLKKKNI